MSYGIIIASIGTLLEIEDQNTLVRSYSAFICMACPSSTPDEDALLQYNLGETSVLLGWMKDGMDLIPVIALKGSDETITTQVS